MCSRLHDHASSIIICSSESLTISWLQLNFHPLKSNDLCQHLIHPLSNARYSKKSASTSILIFLTYSPFPFFSILLVHVFHQSTLFALQILSFKSSVLIYCCHYCLNIQQILPSFINLKM